MDPVAAPGATGGAGARGGAAGGAGAGRGAGAGAAAAAATPLQLPAGNADLAQGRKLYRQYCAGCHGDTGLGGTGNGAPLVGVSDIQRIANTVWNGKNTHMPSFQSALKPAEVRDIANYISKEIFTGHAQ